MSEIIDLTGIIRGTGSVFQTSTIEIQARIQKLFLPVLTLESIHNSLKKGETLLSTGDKCVDIKGRIYDKFSVVKDGKIIRVSLEEGTVYLFDGKTFLLV